MLLNKTLLELFDTVQAIRMAATAMRMVAASSRLCVRASGDWTVLE